MPSNVPSNTIRELFRLKRQASSLARTSSPGRFVRLFGLILPSPPIDVEAQQQTPSQCFRTELRPRSAQRFTAMSQLRATIFNSPINILLLAVPAGIALHMVASNPISIFAVNFVGIIPLAAMLSYATEEVALRTGDTIGGLLNASFGNAVELIVAVIALTKHEVLIVQTSLIGSILSNLLLVMGMGFFFGGIGRLEQRFNLVVAQTAASLLTQAVGSLIIVTAFHEFHNRNGTDTISLSRGTSVLLLVVYGCYLYFSLASHRTVCDGSSIEQDDDSSQACDNQPPVVSSQAPATQMVNLDATPGQPQLSILVALLTLAASTALVAVCAEFMVDSISALTASGTPSPTFVGLILLPIVGNAAEHTTAVTVACKGKMDLAIGVAVGSSLQITLLVLPSIVVLGWMIGVDMPLNVGPFELCVLFVSVLLVTQLISDGKSHWLEGILPMNLYLIIAMAVWLL